VTALYELTPVQPLLAARQPAEQDEPLKYQLSETPPKPEVLAFKLSEAAASGEILTLKLRYKEPDGQQSKLSEHPVKDRGGKFSAASKDFQFASAVASFGMVLRNSQYRGECNLAAVAEIAASSLGEDEGGYRAEFVDLVRKAHSLGIK
jgi:Ca-activated chloride channel family protein